MRTENTLRETLGLNLSEINKSLVQQTEIKLVKKDIDDILIAEIDEKIFQYWLSQNKFIPPWEIHWYQLKDKENLTLKDGLLEELIKLGENKAGNLNRLRKVARLSTYTLYYGRKNNKISVKGLKRLLFYLNIHYNAIDNKIIEIGKGKKASIKNPKFPINLKRPEAASVMGALVSDGSISIDRRARNTKRIKYSTQDFEDIKNFKLNVRKVFGEVLFSEDKYKNSYVVRIGTSIIPDGFLKVGCILGNKNMSEKGIPWIIKEGDFKMKKRYLQSVFSDEGSVGRMHKPYVILSRSKDITNLLTQTDFEILKKFVEPFMKTRKLPGNYIFQTIGIKKFINLLHKSKHPKANQLLLKIKKEGFPKLLLEESRLLEELKIKNNTYLIRISKTSKGRYTVISSLIIRRKKSLLRFVDKIGFQSSFKQEKIKRYLREVGWL